MDMRLDNASQTWDLLAQRLEQFIEAWDQGQSPPKIDVFLPESPANLRRLTLIELIKVDLEYRWKTPALARRSEDYLVDFPELAAHPDGVPADVVCEEIVVRQAQGETVRRRDFIDRFPQLREPLDKFFEMQHTQTRTSMAVRRVRESIQAGDRIDDFDLLVLLGKGAFAQVFLARQRSLQRLVAVKISADRGNEPQTLAQLDHPFIVRVFDQRILPERKLRLLYMQYVAGGTLADLIERLRYAPPGERTGKQFLSGLDAELSQKGETSPSDSLVRRRLARADWPETVCRIGISLAQALDYAHQRGVLHRDLKPANVLIAADGSPKLADFNISWSNSVAGDTPAAYFGGSLAYMSPEQLEASHPQHVRRPEDLDGRSDIYALGVVLWELLFGGRPFADERLGEGWNETLTAMIARRRSGPPEVPPYIRNRREFQAVARVICACLAPDAEQRPASAGEAARLLALCLAPRTQQLLFPPGGGWREWVKRRPIFWVLLALIVPNALAAVFNYLYNEHMVQSLNPETYALFKNRVQVVVNGIAFPLGGVLMGAVTWPVGQAIWKRIRGQAISETARRSARQRALSLSLWAAALGLAEWVLAGCTFPICLDLAGGGISSMIYGHFIVSHVVCGLIAASYPFYLISFLALRALYPALLGSGGDAADDEPALARLSLVAGWSLLAAGGVPTLGAVLIALGGVENRLASLVLSLAGVAGLGLAFIWYRSVQRDVAALIAAIRPLESFGTSSGTSEM